MQIILGLFDLLILNQEAGTSATFGRHVSNQLKITYSKTSHQELSIGICMGPIRGGGGGGGRVFLGGSLGVSKNFLGHFYGISNISSES